MRREIIALVLVLLATIGTLAAVSYYRAIQRNSYSVELLARRVEFGNWLPRRVEVPAGEKVRLLVRNVDTITHGLRIPALGIENEILFAGQTKVIEFTADKPGVLPFSCTMPCSLEHMEMRGTITVIEKAP